MYVCPFPFWLKLLWPCLASRSARRSASGARTRQRRGAALPVLRAMAGAQTSEVDGELKSFLGKFPTAIGYVVPNSDGIPVKHHEHMPYQRAVMYAALLSDFMNNGKKCLKDLLDGPAESELANVRIRTKEGTEIICVTVSEYTFVVIQNCIGKEWVQNPEGDGATGEGAG